MSCQCIHGVLVYILDSSDMISCEEFMSCVFIVDVLDC